MKMVALIALLACLGLPAAAHDYSLGDLRITHLWAAATTPKATMSAAYVLIENSGTKNDVLTGADSKSAGKTELHESKTINGIATMRRLNEAPLPAGKKVEFRPGGMHIMLIGLKQPLIAGETISLTLHFAKAGDIDVDAPVQKGVPRAHAMQGIDMKNMPGM